jgi:hypothetical protein
LLADLYTPVTLALPASEVVTVNVALLAPAGTMTVEGVRATLVLLLLSDTDAPPKGAAPFKVIVPVEEEPCVTVVGFRVRALIDAGVTVSATVFATPRVAVSVADVDIETPPVVTVKVKLVEPAGTVTLEGTCAAVVLLLPSVTTAPPVGAAPFNVTVPLKLFPPTMDVTLLVNPDKVGAFTVKVAVFTTPKVPVITTEEFVLTGLVLTVKVADVAPLETITLAGTVAAAVLLLDSVTTAPPVGAAVLKMMVPVEPVPPVMVVGLNVSDARVAAGVTVRVALCATP